MCNGRSAQQESGAALSKIIMYSYYTRCALIREVETVERRKIANEDQEETVERREREMPLRRGGRTACLRRGPIIIYSYYTKCALIRECQPTARD